MVAMTIADAWPTTGREFTVADLERTPDDGRRYEVIDGLLVVSPAPSVWHQEVTAELLCVLRHGCPPDMRALPGLGVRMSLKTELIPDIVVASFKDLTGPTLTAPPLLAVEVRSPSTALFDLNTKKAVYERFGVASYWIVVPEADQPELLAFELREGVYEQVAHVTGGEPFRAERPFPVELVPSVLVAGLRSR